jgi:putative flippase GtrA
MMATRTRLGGKLVGLLHRGFRAHRPVRFLVVGSFNTALCFLVYAGLAWLGLPVWAASFGGLVFGIGLGFLTQGRIVFGNRDPKRFGRFVLGWVIIYGLQVGAIEALVHRGVGPSMAGLIVLPGIVVASYLVQKWLVFRKSGSTT